MKRHEIKYNGRFEFEAGGESGNLKIAFHTSEKPYRGKDDTRKVVWICHALTANSDPSDWWPELVGKGKYLDPDKYFIVCVNMLGSPYGSSGPSSINPETGKPYYFDFPLITVRDIVKANIIVRRHLAIEHADLLIGGSIGGFQVLEWLIMEPVFARNALIVACGFRVSPWVTAFNESQRMALEADPTFRQCQSLKGGESGLRCARSIALISYRSYRGYADTQYESDQDTMFAQRAVSYQQYQGKKLSDRFDAYSYYYLTKSVDSYNVGRGRSGVETALKSVRARTFVAGIDTDGLFPVTEQKDMALMIPGAKFREISSRFGHDGFLLEYDRLIEILDEINI